MPLVLKKKKPNRNIHEDEKPKAKKTVVSLNKKVIGAKDTHTKAERELKEFKNRIKTKKPLLRKNEDEDLTADSIESMFQKRLKKIRSVNKTSHYDENFTRVVLEGMLDTILDLIPISEEHYRLVKSERAVYAANTLFNQSREIINDLRAIGDFEERANKIKTIVQNGVKSILQNLMDETTKSRNLLLQDLDINDPESKQKITLVLQGLMKNQGQYLNELLKSMYDKIDGFLIQER